MFEYLSIFLSREVRIWGSWLPNWGRWGRGRGAWARPATPATRGAQCRPEINIKRERQLRKKEFPIKQHNFPDKVSLTYQVAYGRPLKIWDGEKSRSVTYCCSLIKEGNIFLSHNNSCLAYILSSLFSSSINRRCRIGFCQPSICTYCTYKWAEDIRRLIAARPIKPRPSDSDNVVHVNNQTGWTMPRRPGDAGQSCRRRLISCDFFHMM